MMSPPVRPLVPLPRPGFAFAGLLMQQSAFFVSFPNPNPNRFIFRHLF
jgi:hypothetical protein